MDPTLQPREYWCFISYRHADNKEPGRQWASWLHHTLETYEVPADLVGQKNSRGDTIPERIYPVFRDEEELPADSHLSAPIERALRHSKFLVVLCSPRAVESRFVAEEILGFKAHRPENKDRILAAIIAGEPGGEEVTLADSATSPIPYAQRQCFPRPLRFEAAPDGTLTDTPAEPIAADFRLRGGAESYTSPAAYREQSASGGAAILPATIAEFEKRQELMKLKIIAGILGVPLGTLTARDKAYQLEKERARLRALRKWLAAVAVLSVLSVVGGIIAWKQREIAKEKQTLADKNAANARQNELRALASLSRSAFEDGMGRIEKGEFREGIARLAQAVEITPDDGVYRAALSLALQRSPQPLPVSRPMPIENEVEHAEMNFDGTRVLIRTGWNAGELWDAVTGERIVSFSPTDSSPQSLRFLPDGKRVACARKDGALEISSAADGASLRVFNSTSYGAQPRGLYFILTHDLLVSLTLNGLDFFEMDTLERIQQSHPFWKVDALKPRNTGSLAVTSDGKKIALGGSGSLEIVDTEKGVIERNISLEVNEKVESLSFGMNGRLLVAGTSKAWVHGWDVTTGEPMIRLDHCFRLKDDVDAPKQFIPVNSPQMREHRLQYSGGRIELAFIPLKRNVLVSFTNSNYQSSLHYTTLSQEISGREVHAKDVSWQANTGKLERQFAISPDGQASALGLADGRVLIFDNFLDDGSNTPKVRAQIRHGEDISALAFSGNGRYLITVSRTERTMRLWDLAARPAGDEQITSGMPGVYSKDPRPSEKTLLAALGKVRSSSVGPDGLRVAFISGEEGSPESRKLVHIFDSAQNKASGVVLRHSEPVEELRRSAWSADQRYLVTETKNTAPNVWDAETGELCGPPLTGTGNSVRFAPGGVAAFSIEAVGNEQTFGLWDLRARKWLWGPVPHPTAFDKPDFVFGPDGAVLSIGTDKRARMWDAKTGKLRWTTEAHRNDIDAVYFSKTGDLVCTVAGHDIGVWRGQDGTAATNVIGVEDEVKAMAIAPDGRLAVIATGGTLADKNELHLIDLETGRSLGPLVPSKVPEKFYFSGDGTRLICNDRTIDWEVPLVVGTMDSPTLVHLAQVVTGVRAHPSTGVFENADVSAARNEVLKAGECWFLSDSLMRPVAPFGWDRTLSILSTLRSRSVDRLIERGGWHPLGKAHLAFQLQQEYGKDSSDVAFIAKLLADAAAPHAGGNSWVAYYLGRWELSRGDRAEAERLFRLAISLEPFHPLAPAALAGMENDASRRAGWMDLIRKACDDPGNAMRYSEIWKETLEYIRTDTAAAGDAALAAYLLEKIKNIRSY